jgi:hypothetical protein
MAFDPGQQLTELELSTRLRKEATNHPITLSTGVVSVLGGAAAALFASSEAFVLLAAAAGIGLVSCIGFVMNKTVFGRHRAMLAIIEKVRNETQHAREKIGESVKVGLKAFKDEKGLQQLIQLQGKFTAFENVLNLQFDKDEMTHKRYLTTAEQLYFGAVDNLRNLVVLWHSINAIDSQHIQKQLEASNLDSEVKNTLEQRLAIYNKGMADKAGILSVNEQIMTKLDEVTSRLGSIQTREGLSDVRLDTAMREIMHLIKRTDQYDINNR